MSRPIYGRVYEVILRDQEPGTHAYVGKAVVPLTPHMRIYGASASAHMSQASIAKDPWKARIVDYRVLEVVRTTGDRDEDDRALRRAEAFWIDRLNAVHNDVRPVQAAASTKRRRPELPPPRVSAVPLRPTARQLNQMAARRRARRRLAAVLALAAIITYLAARVVTAMELPWPYAPWIAPPAVGIGAALYLFARMRKAWRKLTR